MRSQADPSDESERKWRTEKYGSDDPITDPNEAGRFPPPSPVDGTYVHISTFESICFALIDAASNFAYNTIQCSCLKGRMINMIQGEVG